jgi:hypothetical protein
MKRRISCTLAFICTLAPLLLGGWVEVDSTSNLKAPTTTFPTERVAQVSVSNPDARAALKDIETIANTLRGLNAQGLRTAAADSDFQSAVSDLRSYLAAAGQTGWKVLLATGDPRNAIIAAAVAGQLEDYRSTANDVLQAVHQYQTGNQSQAAAHGVNIALDKLAGKIADDIAKQSGVSSGTPTPVFDAAKIGARFIMAYESGVLNSVAPNGFAPLLDKNPTTKTWLANIDSYIQSGSIQQRATPPAVTQPPTYPTSVAPSPQSMPAARGPGGISLSQAAAERLPLKLTLEGAYVENGRIILSGPNNAQSGIDAALFLTVLRAACESNDPYFSLDPDDTASWLAETKQAQNEFFEAVKADIAWHIRSGVRRNTPSVLSLRTVLASREYPQLWKSILARHPNLRSKLVFRPEWLRQTRFGEILYKADVLLKELAGGAPTLGESQLRANTVHGYRSATARMAAVDLLYRYNGWTQTEQVHDGGRIWYDLTESSNAIVGSAQKIPQGESELRQLLESRGLLTTADEQSPPQTLIENAGAIDLSGIYPRMFVRAFDPFTHRDSSARFPGLNELVAQANKTPQEYATAYSEYQVLVEVFRAYIVAVRVKEARPSLCSRLPSGLLESEKASAPLPEYHPTELTLTIGWFEYSDGTVRRAIGSPAELLFQGGVSIGATSFLRAFVQRASLSPTIKQLTAQAARPTPNYTWKDDDGRQYVSFALDEASLAAPVTTSEAPSSEPGKGQVIPNDRAVAISIPGISGTIGRFELHEGGRVDGTKVKSTPLGNGYAANPLAAQAECAQICSRDNNCTAFQIDESLSQCQTYSTITKTYGEANWIVGIWK